MDGEHVTLAIAFAAGVVSFVSPCVLPLVPAYVTNLAGISLADNPSARMRLATVLSAAHLWKVSSPHELGRRLDRSRNLR